MLTAALQGVSLVPFVIQEVFQRDEQEGPEAPFRGSDPRQTAVLQKMSEKRLSQVLGFMNRMPASSSVRIKRRPINRAELDQGLFGPLACF